MIISTDLPKRPAYQNYNNIALFLENNAHRLNGVLILPYLHSRGHGDRRITNIYYYHKKDQLPVYDLVDGEIRKFNLVPSRGHIVMLPKASSHGENNLKSGYYAILHRRPLKTKEYKEIHGWIRDMEMNVRMYRPVMLGMSICYLDFLRSKVE